MSPDPQLARYSRQILFAPIGEEGQRRLLDAHVTLVGCGALGSVLANTLARAGVGHLRIVDRDFLELNNLQRQVLFDEQDIADNLPKAEAAARKLRRINSTIEIEPVVADFNPTNAELLCNGANLILDGTDNLETRYLVNDVAVRLVRPWIYGACVAAEGRVLPILPNETPCFRCVWPDPLPPGTLPTCETIGVLAPVVNIVASLQALAALQLLTGQPEALNRNLVTIDAWTGRWHQINVQTAYDTGDCPCCRHGRFEFLSGQRSSITTTLCGRNAVQVLPAPDVRVDFAEIAARLPTRSRPLVSKHLLRFTVDACDVALFHDGRAIIGGTADPAIAKGVYAKYIGV